MFSYKLLRHLKIKKVYSPELIEQWPSYLPETPIDVIMSNEKYKKDRLKYITKGPYIWMAIQMYHN